MLLSKIKRELKEKADPKRAKSSMRFFKTKKGDYGEGDFFIGVSTPDQRKIGREYHNLELKHVKQLLDSRIHDYRSVALFILINKYKKGEKKDKEKIFDFYLKNRKRINNWDLVDISSPHILGDYLLDRDKSVLYRLAKSRSLWERRMSIIATYHFIKNNEFEDTLKISEILLNDNHDLIHKAVGWMLREVGSRSLEKEEAFLKKYYTKMPRTMLRYAIEKFPEKLRQEYLKGAFK